MNKEELYSVKDICKKYSITRKTLFYYDKTGLLKPAMRQGKQNIKFYDEAALKRLKSIIEYREAGLSIEDIRDVIDLDNREEILNVLIRVRRRLVKEFDEKKEELKNLEKLISINS